MREAFDDIMTDLPDALIAAGAVGLFTLMVAVLAMLGAGA